MCNAAFVPVHARFAFIFPMASGHLNPSLPIARRLVNAGHKVDYLCLEQMREAIEDTGAVFHSAVDHEAELYQGRKPDMFGAGEALKRQFKLEEGRPLGFVMVRNVMNELQLPGLLRFLRKVKPTVVVYCPVLNREAALAARVLGIPHVALLTIAGPGASTAFFEEVLAQERLSFDGLDREFRAFEPNIAAVKRLNAKYGLGLEEGLPKPMGRFDSLSKASQVLVTTSTELQDSSTPELMDAYNADGVAFVAVGPLFEPAGTSRAGGHRAHSPVGHAVVVRPCMVRPAEVLQKVRTARAAGRKVALVSMGTVITGDTPVWGWEGRANDASGHPYGLTGRELCRAAWAGAFDAFHADDADEGTLVVVSLGRQQDPLGEVVVPPNAVCAEFIPQVEILEAGVSVFLTHGGQNSFNEALAFGVPLVVCPGGGDQVTNSRKAETFGVGLKVDRPYPHCGEEAAAVANYRADVRRALLRVVSEPAFAAGAARLAQELSSAGGPHRATELVLAVARVVTEGTDTSSDVTCDACSAGCIRGVLTIRALRTLTHGWRCRLRRQR
mmetsp:Transcript_19751/g.54368  ORF Transcript_19751/g.54368 Transcript_19751/m.54368 type:complete len:556 (+) Transcript_19751:54-1721(+)